MGSPENGEILTVSNLRTKSDLFVHCPGASTEGGMQARSCWEGSRLFNWYKSVLRPPTLEPETYRDEHSRREDLRGKKWFMKRNQKSLRSSITMRK